MPYSVAGSSGPTGSMTTVAPSTRSVAGTGVGLVVGVFTSVMLPGVTVAGSTGSENSTNGLASIGKLFTNGGSAMVFNAPAHSFSGTAGVTVWPATDAP